MTRARDTIVSLTIIAAVLGMTATGVIALSADSYANTENDVVTGNGVFPHDLRGKVVPATAPGGVCDDTADYVPTVDSNAAFPVGTTMPMSADLTRIFQESDFCLRNFGTQAADVTIQIQPTFDTDTGCAPEESAYGGDANCNDGDPGELSSILAYRVSSAGGTNSPGVCGGTSGQWVEFDDSASVLVATVDPLESCHFFLSLDDMNEVTPGSVTPQQFAAAQTDRVGWTIVFLATDDL